MRVVVVVCLALVAICSRVVGPSALDLLLISEAYRLTEAVQDSVWPGGLGAVPYPLLLVTTEREFLVAFPRTPPGFTKGPCFTSVGAPILERPRHLPPNLLASFPAFGLPPVIVIGRPDATGKTSTYWVLTVVHEHFHQFQSADPDYYSALEQLDLSDGDKSGIWMLNYPFPYQSSSIGERFSELSRSLARLIHQSSASEHCAFWQSYSAFLRDLSERDRRYLSFQIWQEGIARYIELRTAEVAARVYDPTQEFKALPDFKPFATVAAEIRAAIINELENPNLAERRRVSLYAFGAGLALLLDEDVPDCKTRYLTEKFAIERYIEGWLTTQ